VTLTSRGEDSFFKEKNCFTKGQWNTCSSSKYHGKKFQPEISLRVPSKKPYPKQFSARILIFGHSFQLERNLFNLKERKKLVI